MAWLGWIPAPPIKDHPQPSPPPPPPLLDIHFAPLSAANKHRPQRSLIGHQMPKRQSKGAATGPQKLLLKPSQTKKQSAQKTSWHNSHHVIQKGQKLCPKIGQNVELHNLGKFWSSLCIYLPPICIVLFYFALPIPKRNSKIAS